MRPEESPRRCWHFVQYVIQTCLSNTYTYTIDRVQPYKNSASYKGISRVLQGFEVVLLSRLTSSVIKSGGLPLSLDHDGLLALFEKQNDFVNEKSFVNELVKNKEKKLTIGLSNWSKYLLKGEVPIETKRVWYDGQVNEM